MKSNIEKAVGIIAALSLLLGVSNGRLHQQQQEIRQLKAAHFGQGSEHIRILIDHEPMIEFSTFEVLEEVQHKLKEKEEKLKHFRCRIGHRTQ